MKYHGSKMTTTSKRCRFYGVTYDVKHWGELPQVKKDNTEVIPAELQHLLIVKSMKPEPVDHSRRKEIYQPCKQEEASSVEIPAECTAMDSTVVHTIQLLKHNKKMRNLIKLAKKQAERNEMEVPKPLPPAPPIPEEPKKAKPISFSSPPFKYMGKKLSTFSQGHGLPPPKLSPYSAKKILRKSVGTLLAHVGYESSPQLFLDTLTDVTEEYIQNIIRHLRTAVNQEALYGSTGFPDVMERVFYEVGLGSMKNLHGFYQTRVLKYHENVFNTCKKLDDEYTMYALPVLMAANEAEIIRCIPSETDNEEDIPEIHFPALGEGYSADELQPSLEPGFQMLHSLEQEEQLQNLEPEEEIIISDSPSQDLNIHGTPAESSQATASGSTNKGRKKKKKKVTPC